MIFIFCKLIDTIFDTLTPLAELIEIKGLDCFSNERTRNTTLIWEEPTEANPIEKLLKHKLPLLFNGQF